MVDFQSENVVAHFSVSDETVDLLRWLRNMSAVHDFIWCHFVDLNKARINGTESLRQRPHVVVIDIAPADLKNWRFVQALCAVPAIWGSPDILYQVVIDIEGATLGRRGHVAT
jgi:hypothetical protein